MIAHRDEIFSRPKRTWFVTEKEKKLAAKAAKVNTIFFFNPQKFAHVLVLDFALINKNIALGMDACHPVLLFFAYSDLIRYMRF